MKKKEFIEYLEKKTGLTHEKDFGFILGTHCPWEQEGLLASDRPIRGFLVWHEWKGKDKKMYGREIKSTKLTIKEIVKFLKDKTTPNITGESKIVGEF